jgi:hypothetical protein
MQEKGFYRKFYQPGPGGWKCSCCAPPPGQAKKRVLKTAKKRERVTFMDLIRQELDNGVG